MVSITFKKFLEAEVRPMDAPEMVDDLKALADIVRKNCKFKTDGSPYIWRGTRTPVKPSVLNPGSGTRASQNTSNFYTILFDEAPANSKFPKRSESFICTTEYSTARAYSRAREDSLLAIYPLDSVVASVNKSDIWRVRFTLKRLQHTDSLPAVNSMLEDVLGGDTSVSSTQDIVKAIRSRPPAQVRNAVMEHDFGGISSTARNATDEEFVDMLIADIQDSYVFEDLGMSLESVDDVPPGSEVWFSGKCVAIPESRLDEFKSLLLEE